MIDVASLEVYFPGRRERERRFATKSSDCAGSCRREVFDFFKVFHLPVGPIKLFTYTAAILNLLDLRSIMGCPGGTRSVFTRAFRTKENFNVYFPAKGDYYYIQTRHNDLSFPLQSFSRKT